MHAHAIYSSICKILFQKGEGKAGTLCELLKKFKLIILNDGLVFLLNKTMFYKCENADNLID